MTGVFKNNVLKISLKGWRTGSLDPLPIEGSGLPTIEAASANQSVTNNIPRQKKSNNNNNNKMKSGRHVSPTG